MAIEVHFDKQINNLTLVREADTRQQHEYMLVTFFAGLFVLGLVFYGWQHYRWIQFGYQIQAAEKKKGELEESGRELRAKRAYLRSLERIDAIARNQLGMVAPLPGQTVTLNADSPLVIPSPQEETPQLAARK